MGNLLFRFMLIGLLLAGVARSALAATSEMSPGPLDRAAVRIEQPERALLNGIVRAGQRLVAVGEHGVIIWSDNHGKTWHQAAVPVDVNLTAVAFAGPRNGWAVGHQGVVLSSDDGGEHWNKRLDGVQAAAQQLQDEPDKPLLALQLDGADKVNVVGAYNLALRSEDAGKTWQALSSRLDNPGGLHLYALQRQGQTTFVAGEQGLLLAADSADGSFKPLDSPYEGSYFGLLPLSQSGLLLFGLRGHVFRSGESGQHWQRIPVSGAKASFNAGLQLDDGRIVLLDQAGRVYLSHDQGHSFQPAPFAWGAPLTAVAETANGNLVITSLAGIVILPAEQLATPLNLAQEPGQ